jgi:hypothetical protein
VRFDGFAAASKLLSGASSEVLIVDPHMDRVGRNVSPAYLFRKVGSDEGVTLLHEIDTVFGPKARENEELRGLLNAGYRRALLQAGAWSGQ